jgi:CTP synthase (UTP-ammonia lyase)
LNGLTQSITILKNTIGYSAYNKETASEQFLCNYGVNPKFQNEMIVKPLTVSAVGPEGEIRMIELTGHHFYLATLFVPQMLSTAEAPHPLITDFVTAAQAFQLHRSML